MRHNGFADLQDAHLAVFSYPLPDGVRPSDLARQLHISRQATNYLVGQLEALGYLERRAGPGNDRRRVYLTGRGQSVADVIYASLGDLQMQWAREVGDDRFMVFMDVLKLLSKDEIH